jgi:hypothetical protein
MAGRWLSSGIHQPKDFMGNSLVQGFGRRQYRCCFRLFNQFRVKS